MCCTISEIAAVVDGTLIHCTNHTFEIKNLLTDSRQLTHAHDTLFFALNSDRNNGHEYIRQLFDKGLRSFVVSKIPDDDEINGNSNIILVNNTLRALQALGAYHRSLYKIPVIGITGSNGKTIVKEWLRQLLSEDQIVVANPKSYNSQIGVPLSVWQMNSRHEVAVFEAGISLPDEMHRLEQIIKPTIGIFTNIGQAHAENFQHIEQKIAEKLLLFTDADTLIYCADQQVVATMITASASLKSVKKLNWGFSPGACLELVSIEKTDTESIITALIHPPLLISGSESKKISIPFTDEASVENAVHCWVYLLFAGFSDGHIAHLFKKLQPVEMRLELKEGINNCSLINDSYSSDLNSLAIALDFLNQQNQHLKKTLILSDIQQSGLPDHELYAEVARLIAGKSVNRLIGIGPSISNCRDKFATQSRFFLTTEDFLQNFAFAEFHNETILLKGARKFEFEQISRLLQQKLHETVLEINLNALIQNLNFYKSALPPKTKIMAMVKAFSYGSGSYEIANILQFHNVDYLAVAYTDEGVELRKAGISLPIMVMNAENQSFDSLFKHDLEPEVYSFRMLEQLIDALQVNPYGIQQVRIHLKLDTGMHRLGFTEDQADTLINVLYANPGIIVESVFSHLAGSDDEVHDAFTFSQIECFERFSGKIIQALNKPVLRHILNSSGIIRFPEACFEMVRLGIGLYGIASEPQTEGRLQNVSTLKTVISQIKTVKAGESIGYSRKWFAHSDLTIGIIPVGYADGLDRKLSNGNGFVKVNGRRVAVIGNICMDMCTIDLTGIQAVEGDEVIIFDSPQDIRIFADSLGTIPYEIITGISQRVKRVYLME